MLEKTFYGNTVAEWALALGIIIGAVLAGKAVYWVFKSILKRITAKTKTRLDDLILDTIDEPLSFALVLVGINFGVSMLTLSDKVLFWVDKGIYILIVITIAWMINRIFKTLIQEYVAPLVDQSESDLDDQLLPLLRKGVQLVVWIIAIIIGLDNAGYNIGAILAGLGIGGLALAMAAKDTVANLFGSFTIFMDRPFKLNERIVINGTDGTVKEVGIRSTRIVTLEGRTVTIPNSHFQNSVITNITSEPTRKVSMTLGLTYDMDNAKMQQAMDILKEISEANQNVDENYLIAFTEFGASSLNILFIYYILKESDILNTMTAMNMEILKRFNSEGLDFAFPTQTIYQKSA